MKKIIRVITSNYCVPAHLDNTLKRIPKNVQLYVIGENVRKYASTYSNTIFIDLPIKRNLSVLSDLYVLFKLVILFRQIKPHIVHSLMVKAGLISAIAGRISGVKIRIHTFTGQIWANKGGISECIFKFVDKLICRLATDCLTDSPSQSEFLYQHGIKKFGRPVKCLVKGSLSGVDLNRFSTTKIDAEKKHLKVDLALNNEFVLGYIARKSVDKGCIDMLTIFLNVQKACPTVKLLYIGPDESNGSIDKFYQEYPYIKNHIIDLGFVHNHEHYLSLCNILCLPSHREGFGSIVIDASALSIPTIGYRIPGLVDSILDGTTGILVELGDTNSFSNEIVSIIKNPNTLNVLSVNSRTYVEKYFDADLINRELYEFYDIYSSLEKHN